MTVNLAAALTRAAAERGADLGEIKLRYGTGAVIQAEPRGRIGVSSYGSEYHIGMAAGNHNWASGRTGDLLEVVEVAHFWRGGATLRQLHERFPFMRYEADAQAWEDGEQVEFTWRRLLADPMLAGSRPVLAAAYAEPRLRPLTPMVTHGTLYRFLDGDDVVVYIEQKGEQYEVGSATSAAPTVVATLAEMITVASALTP